MIILIYTITLKRMGFFMTKLTVDKEAIANGLKGKDLLTLLDYTSAEVMYLIEKAVEMKKETKKGNKPPILAGKTLGMIFEKSSTRTRTSFEVGMIHLGGHGLLMNTRDLQIGRGEPVSDTGQVLSQFLDGIMIRANSHEMVEELAKYSTIPVINGLTDIYHPCQALADLQTIIEEKGSLAGLKLSYIGDGNNVANSLVIAAAHAGMHVTVGAPAGYECDAALIAKVKEIVAKTGGSVTETTDPVAAAKDADAIYTDVWTSMGQEAETAQRLKDFKDFQINDDLVSHAKDDYMFLHCLPAIRGEEVAASVIDGPNSHVFEQAGNRLHAQKAVLASLL